MKLYLKLQMAPEKLKPSLHLWVRFKCGVQSNSTDLLSSSGDATDIRYLELTNCDVEEVEDQEFMSRPYAFAVQKGNEDLRDALSNA